MPKAQLKPILNSSLPPQFRQVRMVLAREPDHPDGDAEVAYVFVAPFDSEERIDARLWRHHRDACRVSRQRPHEQETYGHLVHRGSKGWGFHYDNEPARPDDIGFHFANERFVVGEYVSISESGRMHTYRVTSVSHL